MDDTKLVKRERDHSFLPQSDIADYPFPPAHMFVSQSAQPVEKLLAELIEECMNLTAQRWALEGDKRAKTRKRAYTVKKRRDELDKRWQVAV
jgi:hypothetical protein